jgi:hypothetical protein
MALSAVMTASLGELHLTVGRSTNWPVRSHFVTSKPHSCTLRETLNHAGMREVRKHAFSVDLPAQGVIEEVVLDYDLGEPWQLLEVTLSDKEGTLEFGPCSFVRVEAGDKVALHRQLHID